MRQPPLRSTSSSSSSINTHPHAPDLAAGHALQAAHRAVLRHVLAHQLALAVGALQQHHGCRDDKATVPGQAVSSLRAAGGASCLLRARAACCPQPAQRSSRPHLHERDVR